MDTKTLVAGIALAAVATAPSVSVAAGGGRGGGSRQEQQAYATPAASAFVAGSGGHVCGTAGTPAERTGCLYFQPRSTERFVDIEVVDASGIAVPVYLDQEDGPIRENDGVFLCGGSDEPIEIAPGLQLLVVIQPVRHEPACVGAATTGTVVATFTKSTRR